MVIRRQLASEPVNVLCCFGAQQLPPVRAARLPAFVSPDQGVVPKLGHVIEHELPRALLGVLPHLIRSRAAGLAPAGPNRSAGRAPGPAAMPASAANPPMPNSALRVKSLPVTFAVTSST